MQGMNSLVGCYGPALIDRALLDALCRALGISFFKAVGRNVAGIQAPGWQADPAAFDMDEFLLGLNPQPQDAARHTVGRLEPINPADVKGGPADDLPVSVGAGIA